MLRPLILAAVFALAALLRIHGAAAAPPLSGFDGPYHAANIGILFFDGRLPLPHEGWSTFHPPLYYAVSAAIWKLLPGSASGETLLFVLRLVNVISGLALGAAVYATARLLIPARPWLAVLAGTLAWFLPMHLGASFLLGNEISAAALSATAMWLLIRCLAAPGSIGRAVALGAVLGLGVLTKFSALVVASVALAMLAYSARGSSESPLRALAPALAATTALVLLSGWYFVGNLARYGRPIVMQNEIVSAEMRKQGYGPTRDLAAYLDPNPEILANPVARPRSDAPAVWPHTFASTWFDPHASVIDPRAPWSRRLAPVLFAGGAFWTAFAVLGAVAVARGRERFAIPWSALALALLALASLTSYIAFTWRIATLSALKGTYLSAGVPAFVLFAALGAERIARRSTLATGVVATAVAGFVISVASLFWVGGLAPLAIQPALAYRLVYSDAATERVLEVFLPKPLLESTRAREP
jgi:4-amino-4-deoxy-L-arabinose transferase-like glycosyltransferase